ncbi:MAG: (E)-4-hydroxy-3-methylbut-2-enyl-diphosphate synthase [Bacteroidales bacterium]|nr:(E)-4-hydroxy-3-methylbut-2-enyl-diphosphate synthase [Bacteroidales bacterium]
MKTITAKIGKVCIGGGNPIAVQTMCNTHTADIEASFAQCVSMAHAGADIIRLTVQGMAEVEAISKIHDKLRAEGIDTPLVADIHFRSDVALAAARVVEKVRVNPGNFNRSHQKACEDFRKLIAICKEYGTAIRIGVNHGSLGARITETYGNSPEGMAKAAMEWVDMCIEEDFHNVVISLKASNVVVMVEAYRILHKEMESRGIIFPTHLGVTEAGNGDAARIKSAVGISTLLSEGIGDTIRVSLTEDPVNEIPFGRAISAYMDKGEAGLLAMDISQWDKYLVSVSCRCGRDLLDRKIDDIDLNGPFGPEKDKYLKDELLQACRRRFYRPEYVACPGCGRTMFSLERTFEQVKQATAAAGKNVCIAVMGCIVNGPGEMADADYGYVGEGRGLVSIYKGKEPVFRHVPEEQAIDKLLSLIKSE